MISLVAANIAGHAVLNSPSLLRLFGDDAWKAMWLVRHAGEHLSSPLDAFDPECGWTLRPDLRDVPVPGGGGTANSNHQGFRGAREYPLARTPRTARIVTIGDSFSFGDEVNDGDTFSAQIEQDLASTEVLNLGVHGYGHDQMLLRLRRDGLPYSPDLVILGWVDQDADRDILSFRDYAKPRFVLRGGQLEAANLPVPSPEEYLRAHRWEPALVILAQLAGDRLATWRQPESADSIATALLAEIVRLTRNAGAIPLFVHLPNPHGGAGEPAQMRSFCIDQTIECVFPDADLDTARAGGTPIIRQSHYSPEAHRIVARAIERYIAERHLLPTA